MELVSERVSDGEVLRLLQLWLDAEIVTEVESWNPIKGTPQGAVISPLLANIYLSGLDAHMTELGYRMVRYADDEGRLCASPPSEPHVRFSRIRLSGYKFPHRD